VLNTFTGKTERIGRIVEMHADEREELDRAQAGDIVAFDRHEEHADRPHPVRSEQPGDAGADGLPGAGDLDRGQAEGQGRSRRWASRSAR
jgi:hypothetical protein